MIWAPFISVVVLTVIAGYIAIELLQRADEGLKKRRNARKRVIH